jgi:putative MATE family efflux protein
VKRTGLSRALWRISLPIMFAGVSEIVLHVTNTIFLARVGVTELAAIAIADSIWFLFLVLPLGLVDGIQILTARHVGRGRPWAVGAVFRQGLMLLLAAAVVLAVALRLAAPWLVHTLVGSPAVAAATRSFLEIACFAIPLTAASFACSALFTSLGRTAVLVPATLVLALTNVALDYAFILGGFGAPVLGIRGAAWSTIGAESATVLFLLGYLVTRGYAKRFRLFAGFGWSARVARRLLRLSAPVSLQALLEAVRWLVFFLILERVGATPLAVANIVFACYEVFRIPTEAFGETACSMVSRVIGSERFDRIEPVIRRSTLGAALATLPMVALALALPDWLLSVFTLDDALIDAGRASVRVVALTMVAIIPAEMWREAVLGTGDTPASLGIEAVLTIVTLAASYWTAIRLGSPLELVWGSLVVAWGVALVASWAWMKSGAWRRLAY